MSTYRHLVFDTECLECKTARIAEEAVSSVEALQECVRELCGQGYELAFWTCGDEALERAAAACEWFPGVAVGERVVLSCATPSASYTRPSHYVLSSVPRGKPSEALVQLSFIAGSDSRFRADPSMTQAQFERIFKAWMTNSCQRTVADEVFAYYNRDDPSKEVGVITLQKKTRAGAHGLTESYASIGLLAVAPEHRRKGVATALLERAHVWASEHRMSLEVVTQGNNAAALALYERAGFVKQSVARDYHLWLPISSGVRIRANLPYVTGREGRNLKAIFRSKAIESCGAFTARCQAWIKEKMQTSSHVLLTGSATTALEQTAMVIGVGPGDEVIMPSYTFVSTANAFVLRGATPVFVDVRADTLNIDETKIEAAITPKTRAICVVHYAGVPCNMDVIMAIAERHQLVVIEDAAQAFLSTYNGRYLGTIGHLGCFSFHYTKNVMAGEGGAVCINDARFLERCMITWEKGTNRFDFINKKVDKYYWLDIGSSFVPNELMAAFLLPQLECAEAITAKRRLIFEAYDVHLRDLAFKMRVPGSPASNGHIFWVCLDSTEQREQVQRVFQQRNIDCYTHYLPLHVAPAGKKFGRVSGSMEFTDLAGSTLVRLPIWPAMNWQHVHSVIATMREALNATPIAANVVRDFFYTRRAREQ